MKIKSWSRVQIFSAVLFLGAIFIFIAASGNQNLGVFGGSDNDNADVRDENNAVEIKQKQHSYSLRQRPEVVNFSTELFQMDIPKIYASGSIGDLAPTSDLPILPYSYMGKMIDGDIVSVFLLRDGHARPYVATKGEVLDGEYVIESIGSDSIEFKFIPLNQKQTLYLGKDNRNGQYSKTDANSIQNLDEITARLKKIIESGASE